MDLPFLTVEIVLVEDGVEDFVSGFDGGIVKVGGFLQTLQFFRGDSVLQSGELMAEIMAFGIDDVDAVPCFSNCSRSLTRRLFIISTSMSFLDV